MKRWGEVMKKQILFCLSFGLLAVTLLFEGALVAKAAGPGEARMEKHQREQVFVITGGTESAITVEGQRKFYIKIEGNIATGYSWEPGKPLDKNHLEFLGVVDEDDENEELEGTEEETEQGQKRLGAPQMEILKFKALAVGEGEIFLVFRRPWEKDVKPVKTHKIVVTIR